VNVLAQWIDNDGDGYPDNKVACWMKKNGATMYMVKDDKESEKVTNDNSWMIEVEQKGFGVLQDLYGFETNPEFTGRQGEKFDATLEEVLHLVSTGY